MQAIEYVVEDLGHTTPCWVWQGKLNNAGYGRIQRNGIKSRAHRWFYEMYVGPIPEGMTLDHLCHQDCAGGNTCPHRACVNPAHLEPVSRGENVRRGARARPPQTHCKRGHEFTTENTRIGASGSRFCLACEKNRERQRYSK